MQKAFALLAMLTVAATRAPAQQSRQTELGVQGGWTRLVIAGSHTGATDVVSVPGFNLGTLIPSAAGLYVVMPASQQVAIETDFSASQFSAGGTVTVLSLGLRGNVALSRQFYAAAGGTWTYINGIANENQVGLDAAVGYRHPLSGPVNGRIEFRTTFLHGASNAPAVDAYSLLFGASTTIGRTRSAASAPRAASRRAWSPRLGVSGGYANVHLIGTGYITALAFPGYGGAFGNTLGSIVPGIGAATLPPTMFAIIPLADKVAIEPGLDLHRLQGGGQTTFSGNFSARFDYAVTAGWYAGLGGNLQYLKSTGVNAATRSGVNLAWGYRFPMTGALGGRVEMNYTMFGRHTTLGFVPTNVFGLMLGATMPLR